MRPSYRSRRRSYQAPSCFTIDFSRVRFIYSVEMLHIIRRGGHEILRERAAAAALSLFTFPVQKSPPVPTDVMYVFRLA